MRSHSRSKLMWSVTVATLLWFAAPAGAIPLESWDDKIPSASLRFRVLSEFNNEAVLDRETQLVWQRSPDIFTLDWKNARFGCANLTTGNRKGWRLPSIPELASLVDPANNNPALPTGHPFFNVQSSFYWSATTDAVNPTDAWGVRFDFGGLVPGNKAGLVGFFHFWCVRGGMNADQY